MEISTAGKNSIKIKTKNAIIVVDPEKAQEQDVILLTSYKDIQDESAKLIVVGAGEYEVGGVSIKAEKEGENIVYELFDDSYKVAIFPSATMKKIKGDDDVDAVIVHVTNKADMEKVEELSSDIILIYGDEENVVIKEPEVKRLPRVNLKKKEEVKGSIVYLS